MTGAEYSALRESSPEKAYAALFGNYCDYVYAIVYNKLRSVAQREDIEECVSDIFADIFLTYSNSDEFAGDMKGFIGTVSKRRAINAYHRFASRSEHDSGESDDYLAGVASRKDIESEHELEERRCILLNKIDELGEPDSTIILQKYYYDRSSAEIAKMLSMKPRQCVCAPQEPSTNSEKHWQKSVSRCKGDA